MSYQVENNPNIGTNVIPTAPTTSAPAAQRAFCGKMDPDTFEPQKKKGGFLGFVIKTVVAAGLVAGALVATRKCLLTKVDLAVKPEGILNNAKHYAAKAGDFVEEQYVKVTTWAMNHFKKKEPPVQSEDQ